MCEQVRQAYSDAYLTAHFEVPGEMFTLAMQVGKEEGWGAGVEWGGGGGCRALLTWAHLKGGEVQDIPLVGIASAECLLLLVFTLPLPLPMQAKRRGMGVVGSTSNILDFIAGKVGPGNGSYMWGACPGLFQDSPCSSHSYPFHNRLLAWHLKLH